MFSIYTYCDDVGCPRLVSTHHLFSWFWFPHPPPLLQHVLFILPPLVLFLREAAVFRYNPTEEAVDRLFDE
jgi:hypothetical protein